LIKAAFILLLLVSYMENKIIARRFKLLSQLMELHNVNPFKIRSIANAAFKIDKLPYSLTGKTTEELEKIEGIGKSIAANVQELVSTGTLTDLEELTAATPPGVIDMLHIKGIGPKKINVIWHDLGIDNVGELYYACNENRLAEAKGFGLKTQEEILKAIEFTMASNGKFLYARARPDAEELLFFLRDTFPGAHKHFAGEYRRCCEIIIELIIVIGTRDKEAAITNLSTTALLTNVKAEGNIINGYSKNGLPVKLVVVDKRDYYMELFVQTGNPEHVKAILNRVSDVIDQPESEELIYKKAGLEWMPPELREGDSFLDKAVAGLLPDLIDAHDLKGTLHNHSTWSDGINTLEEMALYCRDEMKLEYLGICDHSKSAFYAKGLSIERVLQQHEEIDHLNKKLENFRILKGIESDILNDGSLDYPDEILQRFDFIVASVHSVLNMNKEKATTRLVKAIENPYTTILGHPTGRLLLSRKGYEIDYKKVIDACAANGVSIEINANPLRLDLDWRWHQYALEKGVWLAINPDAHRTDGLHDVQYGVLVARKGGLTKETCLNALDLQQLTDRFAAKKNNLLIKQF